MNAPPADHRGNPGQAVNEVFVCGLPGQRLAETIEFVRQSLAQAAGICTVINVNTITDEVIDEIDLAQQPVLLWSDNPDCSFVDYAEVANSPVILLDCPFGETACEFMATRGANLSDTMRVFALARTGWWQLAKLPCSIIISPSEDFGRQVKSVLSYGREADGFENPVGFLNMLGKPPIPPLLTSDAEAIECLAEFYGRRSSEDAQELTIPLQLLFDGAPPHGPLVGTINLVGPVRALSFGPFLYLPEGEWNLTFSFATSTNRSGNSLMFDIFVDDEAKNETEFALTSDGRFDFACEFAVRDPRSTFEFRSHLRRGAIEGRIEPLSLRLRKL